MSKGKAELNKRMFHILMTARETNLVYDCENDNEKESEVKEFKTSF